MEEAKAISIRAQAPLTPRFGPEQIDLIKRTICKGASDDELRLFMYQAERTGLDPLARQIYAVKRWDSKERREVMALQTSIDGFRLIAQRTGEYAGQVGPFWCGEDGKWVDVWLADKPPAAAKVGILRKGFEEPCWGVARFDSYAQRNKEGKLTRMWDAMGDVMISKCAESLGLRKAFPQELSGIYTNDEMDQAIDVTPPKSAHKARKDGDWETLVGELKACTTVFALKAWGNTSRERVHQLPDSWQAFLREEYERRMSELEEGVTEDGEVIEETTVKKQLKASKALLDAGTEGDGSAY